MFTRREPWNWINEKTCCCCCWYFIPIPVLFKFVFMNIVCFFVCLSVVCTGLLSVSLYVCLFLCLYVYFSINICQMQISHRDTCSPNIIFLRLKLIIFECFSYLKCVQHLSNHTLPFCLSVHPSQFTFFSQDFKQQLLTLQLFTIQSNLGLRCSLKSVNISVKNCGKTLNSFCRLRFYC